MNTHTHTHTHSYEIPRNVRIDDLQKLFYHLFAKDRKDKFRHSTHTNKHTGTKTLEAAEQNRK